MHPFRKLRYFGLGFLLLFGLTLVGVAPTGFVVGSAAQREAEVTAELVGGLIIVVSLLIVAGEAIYQRKKLEEEEQRRKEKEIGVA